AAQTLQRIRDILARSRSQALQSVNAAMVQAYWHIGREIVEEEQRGSGRAGYGARLIETLARTLTADFGRGFTHTNLWYMRQFYLTYPNLHALRGELSWTHYRLLLKVDRPEARAFYEVEAVQSHWSTRELERQINSLLFERLALSRDKEGVLRLAEQGAQPYSPADLVRDPFVLEFTGLPERGLYPESELEEALMNRLQEFLLELGSDFFFVARQKRLTIDGEHYKLDLLFYHRSLRCFVLIDLKIGKLTYADIGQMLLYVGYYEAEETRDGEGPPVGIILCTDKSEAVVRYTLSGSAQQVFAARYQMHLPTEEELQRELVRERDAFLLEQQLGQKADQPAELPGEAPDAAEGEP
ncbi:MAG TPA: PDDEXK nuclease domain-containing protein, partial [Herpetosiphonaceae bacterium]|nr:PDDEXK nuclease domain-containing protein [Herpetosiphonaceae bacterium]